MKVIGLDLSLTSTGVAVATQDGAVTDRITSKPVPNATLEDRDVRLYAIQRRVMEYVTGDVDLVVVEGPSYGSTTGHQHDRAGLWWLVVRSLFRQSSTFHVVEVPPSSRMKYATGRGNASKDDVLSAAIRRYPHVDVNGNDEADALVLAAMGARWLGHPLEGQYHGTAAPFLPQTHLAAMDAVHWPNPDRIAG
jgi:crossover junction endodeoxyribonuclease RuvC